jgi:hypothetical protein
MVLLCARLWLAWSCSAFCAQQDWTISMPRALAATMALLLPPGSRAAPEVIQPDFAVMRGWRAKFLSAAAETRAIRPKVPR